MNESWTSRFTARIAAGTTKRRVFGLLGAGLLLGSVMACSNAPHHGPRSGMASISDEDVSRMRERFLDKATRELALDDAQKARLAALADAVNTQRKALMPAAGTATQRPREALVALMQGDKFNRSGAQALIDAKTKAVQEQAPAVVSATADFYDSLKPEQQQKVRDLMQRGGGHHRFWRG